MSIEVVLLLHVISKLMGQQDNVCLYPAQGCDVTVDARGSN